MAKRFVGLRLVPLALVLALALGACGASTETVATVGGTRITRGELNAAVADTNAALARIAAQQGQAPQVVAAQDILPELINSRLLELAARDNKIQVAPADLTATNEQTTKALIADIAQTRDQQQAQLAGQAAAQVRQLIGPYGGNAIPDAELQALVTQEVERMRHGLATRGAAVAIGSDPDTSRRVVDEAIAFRNAIAAHGVAVPPETLQPLVSTVLTSLDRVLFLGSNADLFQLGIDTRAGGSRTIFQQVVHDRAYQQKLRPLWYQPQLTEVILQELRTDSQAKALEAIGKGRAGTPFADLLQAYQLPSVAVRPNDNQVATPVVLAFQPRLLQAFKGGGREGEYSEPLATADGSQFTVFRVVRATTRATTAQEEESLFQRWAAGLATTYPVTYNDPTLEPLGVAP